MKVKAIILDRNRDVQNEIKGVFNQGTFKYKLGGLLGKQMEIPCDIRRSMKGLKGEKLVYFVDDGVNFHQVDMLKKKSSEAELNIDKYLDSIEKGIMAKELSQVKPNNDLVRIVEFLLIAGAIISAVISLMNTNSLAKLVAQGQQPLNQSLHQEHVDALVIENLSVNNQRFINATLSYLRNHQFSSAP